MLRKVNSLKQGKSVTYRHSNTVVSTISVERYGEIYSNWNQLSKNDVEIERRQ